MNWKNLTMMWKRTTSTTEAKCLEQPSVDLIKKTRSEEHEEDYGLSDEFKHFALEFAEFVLDESERALAEVDWKRYNYDPEYRSWVDEVIEKKKTLEAKLAEVQKAAITRTIGHLIESSIHEGPKVHSVDRRVPKDWYPCDIAVQCAAR